jgi:hypothetical protein
MQPPEFQETFSTLSKWQGPLERVIEKEKPGAFRLPQVLQEVLHSCFADPAATRW